MAVFREFNSQKRDRSAGDRNRHKELVRDYIRKGIADIIAEEAVIGQSKNKVIKVPIKGLKEYSFIFGKNNKGVAQGTGNEKKGQVVEKGKDDQEGVGGPGNKPGQDVYETEITMEEAINLMFEDLELPQLELKKIFEIEVESQRKLLGYKRKGIRSRLAKRKTVINRVKRKISKKDSLPENESFPFHNSDLVYKKTVTEIQKQSNAVIFCIMDTSGSMDQVKKYLARSFYFLLYQFINTRYRNTEIVFIAHHSDAKEVSEEDFFHKVESGGTCISSGYKRALEIIDERYNPAIWNIYTFHCSDGDNFSHDDEAAVETAGQLAEVSNLFGYGEIKPHASPTWSSMIDKYDRLNNDNFICLKIQGKEDIWPTFKKFLSLEKTEESQLIDDE